MDKDREERLFSCSSSRASAAHLPVGHKALRFSRAHYFRPVHAQEPCHYFVGQPGPVEFVKCFHINNYGRPALRPPSVFRLTERKAEELWGSKIDSKEFNFCRQNAEGLTEFQEMMSRRKRSLCLLKVERIATIFKPENSLKSRLAFYLQGKWYRNETRTPGFPCTSLRWRAMQQQRLAMPKFTEVYNSFGLARPFVNEEGRQIPAAPMVISIIGEPPLKGEIDFTRP